MLCAVSASQYDHLIGPHLANFTFLDVYQMLPPLMTTINEQTGITLPEWQFGRLNNQMGQVEKAKQVSNLNGNK